MSFKERFKGKTSTINKQGMIGQAAMKPVPVGKSIDYLDDSPNSKQMLIPSGVTHKRIFYIVTRHNKSYYSTKE